MQESKAGYQDYLERERRVRLPRRRTLTEIRAAWKDGCRLPKPRAITDMAWERFWMFVNRGLSAAEIARQLQRSRNRVLHSIVGADQLLRQRYLLDEDHSTGRHADMRPYDGDFHDDDGDQDAPSELPADTSCPVDGTLDRVDGNLL